MVEETTAVVELKNVTKSYKTGRSEVPALRGISLSIPARAFTMLVARREAASPPCSTSSVASTTRPLEW
jgi:hypothetical protein